MIEQTLFDGSYAAAKACLIGPLIRRLRGMYTPDELAVLRIDGISQDVLAARSGRGFVNRDVLETVLGNLLECVAPGSHNVPQPTEQKHDLTDAVSEIADQVYAMIAQSLLAVGDESHMEEHALETTFGLLWTLPELKSRALWNRFASLKDPAVWDAYLLRRGVSLEKLALLNVPAQIDASIETRDFEGYRAFLSENDLSAAFDYQMQLVMSTYPGWRILFYHDVAHALTRDGPVPGNEHLCQSPVPLLPRAMTELCGRYYQADLHPETRIGSANFLDHPHRGITTGQTGVIGSGCTIYPCTMGGLSVKVRQRHPLIGDFVQIGTDTSVMGPVNVGDRSAIGTNTEIYGLVEIGRGAHVGSSVVIGTVRTPGQRPGQIVIGDDVRVGDGTIIENKTHSDLAIPDNSNIPARSHVSNDGSGGATFAR